MKKTKCLLIIVLPLIFTAGCIDGVALLSLNKDGSGKVTFEGLFNYADYCTIMEANCTAANSFFLTQIKTMLTSGEFEAWSEVTWKSRNDGKCYFKGTAYFKDINKTDFFIGSIKNNFKIIYNTDRRPTLELKYSPDDAAAGNLQIASLPPALFLTLNVSIVLTLPADIENAENFELLSRQTAMLVLKGPALAKAAAKDGLSGYFRDKGTIKLVLAPNGKDLFDYQSQVRDAQKGFEKILNKIQEPCTVQNAEEPNVEEQSASDMKNDFNSRLRQGLAAELQNDFNEALAIYENIIDDPNADEKSIAAASYQIGACFLKTGEREKAQLQFEYVITNYPQQTTAALKSVKMLQNMYAVKTAEKTKVQQEIPFVADIIPGLYSDNIDPNTSSIIITFSQPMKKTDWFYSSFPSLPLPQSAGKPSFDPCGVKWTLPVKLKPGKTYAIAVNYAGSGEDKDITAGFRSVLEQKCQAYILVFSTADRKRLPTPIDEKIIERCDEINFPP